MTPYNFEIALRRPDGSVTPVHRFIAGDKQEMQREFDKHLMNRILKEIPHTSYFDIDKYIRIKEGENTRPLLKELYARSPVPVNDSNIINWFGEGIYRPDFEFWLKKEPYFFIPVYIPGGSTRYWLIGDNVYFLRAAL